LFLRGIIIQHSNNTLPVWDFVRSGPSYGKDDYSLSEWMDDELLMDEFDTAKTSCSLYVELYEKQIRQTFFNILIIIKLDLSQN
jgi:hypothetical protein